MLAPGQVTQWLQRLHEGDEAALENLVPLLYDELRGMAQQQLRHERPAHTLNPTALVNEVYLKLVQRDQLHASHRTEFLAIAGRTMRRILVDYARAKKRLKRGVFQNVPVMTKAIMDHIEGHNRDPRPIVWTAAADKILEKVGRARAKLDKFATAGESHH